ncbi:UNVERIFIED_CONTAM: hypothetical protein Sradi_0823800 [Sesamum radiatum]|uniref:Uncharacterized protein n=1 Tax=Sesamum radiatum TaxID=300843 RepID=A0AAW2VRH3_SESRA
MAAAVCEIHWILNLLCDFGISVLLLVALHCDNKAAMHIAANLIFHERTKHIEIDCHVVRNAYKECLINLSYVCSSKQLANVFTKVLSLVYFFLLDFQAGFGVPCPQSRL